VKKLAHALSHKRIVSLGVICLLDSLLFMMSNPRNAPPLILMTGFCLGVATLYYAARLVLALAQFYGVPLGSHNAKVAVAITALSGSLMALQTMGQLTVRDIVILLPFLALTYGYFAFARQRTPAKERL
jgi:hypothetical protein